MLEASNQATTHNEAEPITTIDAQSEQNPVVTTTEESKAKGEYQERRSDGEEARDLAPLDSIGSEGAAEEVGVAVGSRVRRRDGIGGAGPLEEAEHRVHVLARDVRRDLLGRHC